MCKHFRERSLPVNSSLCVKMCLQKRWVRLAAPWYFLACSTVNFRRALGRTTCHVNRSVLFIHRQTVAFYSPPAQKEMKKHWNHVHCENGSNGRPMTAGSTLPTRVPHRKWCHNVIFCIWFFPQKLDHMPPDCSNTCFYWSQLKGRVWWSYK